jgi:hypothetical protein
VDLVIDVLCRLRLADGMSLEEHHGFDPRTTPEFFVRNGFTLECWRCFQLSLNNLFVFRKPASTSGPRTDGSLPLREGSLAHA